MRNKLKWALVPALALVATIGVATPALATTASPASVSNSASCNQTEELCKVALAGVVAPDFVAFATNFSGFASTDNLSYTITEYSNANAILCSGTIHPKQEKSCTVSGYSGKILLTIGVAADFTWSGTVTISAS